MECGSLAAAFQVSAQSPKNPLGRSSSASIRFFLFPFPLTALFVPASNHPMPTDITVLDFSAYIGLAAVGAVTLNMLLGTLMAFRYSPVRQWPHRHFNYFRLHNLSGYAALSLAILHPIVLLFDKTPKFRVLDVLYPVHSPSQPLENTIGAVALYVVSIVVVTSYLRIRLGRRLWKSSATATRSPKLSVHCIENGRTWMQTKHKGELACSTFCFFILRLVDARRNSLRRDHVTHQWEITS